MSTLALDKVSLSKKQVIVATTLGTALEYYDFTIYSFFAIQIGQLFFPSASPVNQFLLSIGVFGVGFVVRPLGGIVIGAYADRVGRKKAMVLTIMLMALSCALIACAPPYAMVGMAAPFIVLAARLIQGFAAGGEFGPGTTLLVEYATDTTRAFFASWNFAATALGLALGAMVATLVNVVLPKDAVLEWGWRLPFLLGIVAAPVGMLIRRRLEETLNHGRDASGKKQPGGALKAALTTYLKLTILGGQIVPVLVMIPELFPREVRATGIALTYVVSASFFGGFSPFIASWLVAQTGNPLAPAWYVAAACAISLVPVIWLRDRTGEALD